MRGKRWSNDLKRSAAAMDACGLDKFHISRYTGISLSTVEHLLPKIRKGHVFPLNEAARPPQPRSRLLNEEDLVVCAFIL